MKLLRLELTDWRRFREGPHGFDFHPEATLVAGPNEAGKSTLFEAVRRVLFDGAKTSAAWVNRLAPFGMDGAEPTARLDFEHGGRRYRVEKTFVSRTRGKGTLHAWDGASWVLAARNEEADEALRTLLGFSRASSKSEGARPGDWGAFQWLFVPQDLRDLPAESEDAASHLGLDQAGVSPEFEAVWTRVSKAHDAIIGARGKPLPSSELVRVEKSIGEIEKRAGDLAEELRRLEEVRSEIERIEEALPGLEAETEEARAELEAAREEASGLAGARERRKAAEEECGRRRLEAEHAARVLGERGRIQGALDEAAEAERKASQAHLEAGYLLKQVLAQAEEARSEALRVETELAALRRRIAGASAARDSERAGKRIAEQRERLRRARALDAEILAAVSASEGDPPAPEGVREAAAALETARELRLGMRRASLRVTREGRPAFEVTVDGRPLETDEETALEEVVVRGEGGGSVRIAGDTREAKRMQEEAERLEREAARTMEPFGVSTVEALRALRETRLAQRSRIDSLRREREALDGRDTGAIEQEIAAFEAESKEREARAVPAHPDDAGLSPGEIENRIARLEEEAAAREEAFQAARERRETLAGEVERARETEAEAGRRLAGAVASREQIEAERERHLHAHGSTRGLEETEASARRERDEARKRFEQASDALARMEENAGARLDAAERRHRRLVHDGLEKRERAKQLKQALDRDAAKGVYTQEAEAARRLASETERLGRLKLEAEALALLRAEMEGVRTAVVRRVVEPIRRDLDALLAQATRGRYTLAELDASLWPRTLGGPAPCPFEDGSEGLRELAATLLRIAVARHLAREEPQTLILDDPCAHVSRERTRRLVEILNTIIGKEPLQAIVLTHRVGDFEGLRGERIALQRQGNAE